MNSLIKPYEEKMTKTIAALEHEFGTVRAGRASPAVLDKVLVDYYGTPTQISQMAAISVSEGRNLIIKPWDATLLKSIEKAILASDVGINPTNDGTMIRLVFPSPTEERRKEIAKEIRKYAEEAKVAIRSVRRDANDKFKVQKKDSLITEDDLKELEKDVQTITDKFCKEIDSLTSEKEKEIMEI